MNPLWQSAFGRYPPLKNVLLNRRQPEPAMDGSMPSESMFRFEKGYYFRNFHQSSRTDCVKRQ